MTHRLLLTFFSNVYLSKSVIKTGTKTMHLEILNLSVFEIRGKFELFGKGH